ncbi:TonB-dependent siderophore receptor [Acinetobacter sp. C26M]|uniref:TonB-dependent receptor n=1 Tax=unclassified Acinetobacter TaxID=196816 RepID=UPI0020366EFD|nr:MULTISPECIES: TonB-dependent siderophore receptor [unclassified Acinetobacter]USA45696.1 TonB-dependent siderophore receptor [Acinetobacter sp. C26M]USA49195.1 TonB-dependent siderophore receptor [Acinetobacter sp. C26G]
MESSLCKKRVFPLNVLVSALSLIAGSNAIAADTATASLLPTIEVKADVDTKYVVKKSSTATKTDTLLRDTPQSVSIVTQDQIRDTAAQSIAEATRYVPGLGFQQGEGNRETPVFRGFSTTADFFVDGVRDDVQYYRDLYNIDRVEVLKGPNGMIFGRSAVGGLINRVSKVPEWNSSIGGSLTLGTDSNRRATVDINQALNEDIALRLNGLYENSDSYRDGVKIERSGINPTVAFKLSSDTKLTLGYEHFKDDRIADRGIPSFKGKPVDTDRSTFFGNAKLSPTNTELDALTAVLSHQFSENLKVTNKTRWSDQDKFYQNVFPGAVNAAGTEVSIAAYNNATTRESIFNQTDVNFKFDTAGIRHTLLAGIEIAKQKTTNFRETGYFGAAATATSVSVPLSNPTTNEIVTFRQAASDADNKSDSKNFGIYLQDQIELNKKLQVIAGVRYDHIKNEFLNKRNSATIDTKDSLFSPRIGLIYKPIEPVSLYANYSLAYQPRAGDQLSSLSVTNKELDPEKFINYELGAKWDIKPDLAATFAAYRLDRTNVIILDPNDATKTILGDGQRSQGIELELNGNITPQWSMKAGYAFTKAEFTADTTTTLRDGAQVAQVPKHTISLWNRYDFTPVWGAGLGLSYKSKMFAANELIATTSAPIPNVELPGYFRTDAALYYTASKSVQLQLNVENLFDKKYYLSAHSNNNITPGSPRAFRLGMNFKF